VALTLKKAALVVGAALLLHGGTVSALGLMQAYEAAVKNDPVYRAAFYSAESGKENRVLGRSNLLPNVAASYSASKADSTITVGSRSIPQDYISRSTVVQVRQPLFNMDSWARYKQGIAQSDYSAAQFDSQTQEVILRVTSAYFEVLFKIDQLALAKVERDTYAEQKNVNEQLFRKGEGTRTDVLETQARLDLSEAQLLEAQDTLTQAKDTLAGIIGVEEVDALDQLRPGFRVLPGDTLSFDAWKKIALERNPDIKTLSYGVEIANQEVHKARAGHAPRLDFVAVYQKSASETTTTIGQDTTTRSVGIQLNVPLYSGGSVNATSRQAVANREKARMDLEGQQDKVVVELRKDYNQVASSIPRIDALIKAVDSAQLLITATEQSIKGGVRINLDLLNAQRQLYTAQRDLAQGRYGYMLASLRMRAAAGTLSAEDVRLLAAHFQ
jgi:protease secretion system outer membrane protein